MKNLSSIRRSVTMFVCLCRRLLDIYVSVLVTSLFRIDFSLKKPYHSETYIVSKLTHIHICTNTEKYSLQALGRSRDFEISLSVRDVHKCSVYTGCQALCITSCPAWDMLSFMFDVSAGLIC